MKVRYKNKPETTAYSSEANTYGVGEVILYFPEGDATSEYIEELEVLLEAPLSTSAHRPGTWVPLLEAFRSRDVIPDNLNMRFRATRTEAEKKQGWYDG